MRRVHLEAAEDHVQRLARENDPLGAVKELVWNALDADAMRVDVVLHRSPLGGVERVTVRDDGTGIAPEALPAAYERIGGSWKKWTSGTLLKQRVLHGSSGQGRLRAFALGRRIRWTTVADGMDGRFRTEVAADVEARNDFEIGDSERSQEATGTLFEAWGKQSPRLDGLQRRDSFVRLTTELAPYLTAYPEVKVVFDGRVVDPTASVRHVADYPVDFETSTGWQQARLRIIEWSVRVDRELHLCDENGMPVGSAEVGIRAPGFDFTAYVLWKSMSDSLGEIHLGEIHDPDVTGLVAVAREKLRTHFRDRVGERRRELVERWKADGAYPYRGEPLSEPERLERETFDLVATTVHRHLPRRGKQLRTTLILLREAVRTQPHRVPSILDELFALSEDERGKIEQSSANRRMDLHRSDG